MKSIHSLLGDNPTIWVFGYGSLLWKPDFRFKSKKIGYIKDYERRFYQGNVTFRGKPGQPGRVANLVDMKGSQAWGVAYEISGREEVTQVLQSLYTRESASGGYVTLVTTFYPRDVKSYKNMASICRSSVSDNEFTTLYSSDNSQILHKHQSSLERSYSSISDMSIDELSSDEDQIDPEYKNPPKKTDSFTKTEPHDQFELEDLSHSLEDHNKNVDNLIHYLRSVKSESIQTDESQSFSENCEHSHSLSSSYDRPKGPGRVENTKVIPSPVQVLLYTVTSENDLYLGPDDLTSMARQIVNASGSAGSNVEYVTKTAEFVRKYIPEDQDSHLFSLDAKVREEVYRQQARDSTRLQLGLADLSIDQHEIDQNLIAEPVMAS